MIKPDQIKKPKPAAIFVLTAIFILTALFTSRTNAFCAKEFEGEDTLHYFGQALFSMDNNFFIGRALLEHSSQLKLTAAQEEKIENHVLEHEAFFIRKSAEIKIKELRFASYLKSTRTNVDRKVVERYIREISEEKTDMIVQFMNHLLDLKKLLTPKQVKIARQLKKDFITARRQTIKTRSQNKKNSK